MLLFIAKLFSLRFIWVFISTYLSFYQSVKVTEYISRHATTEKVERFTHIFSWFWYISLRISRILKESCSMKKKDITEIVNVVLLMWHIVEKISSKEKREKKSRNISAKRKIKRERKETSLRKRKKLWMKRNRN